MKRARPDVVVIGGGHNGLVAAALLAKGGLKPLVLERRHALGGATVTEEIHPGYKVSTVAHLAGPLRPSVLAALGLAKHGLALIDAGASRLRAAAGRPRAGAVGRSRAHGRGAARLLGARRRALSRVPQVPLRGGRRSSIACST